MKTTTRTVLKSQPAENGAAPPVTASSKLASEVAGGAAKAGSRLPLRSGPPLGLTLQPQLTRNLLSEKKSEHEYSAEEQASSDEECSCSENQRAVVARLQRSVVGSLLLVEPQTRSGRIRSKLWSRAGVPRQSVHADSRGAGREIHADVFESGENTVPRIVRVVGSHIGRSAQPAELLQH